MDPITNQHDRSLGGLSDRPLDLLVVGGGIVGAGVARDAAMRGLQVALVEQHDFASGTSSRSSRLLHGGIRYLAQARLGLVREANREKTVINRIAPHLSEPLPFLFPTRKGTPWSRWKLGIGVRLYDMLCGPDKLGRSRGLSVRQTLEMLPGLSVENLTGAVRYYDGLTNDARLVIDTLRSATRHGARVFNYVRFVGASSRRGGWRCKLQDVVSGEALDVQTRVVVNATGPWSDKMPFSRTSLRPTKGVHLVVDRERLPVPEAVVMAQGDRILFAIPWGRRVILGTTDTDYDGPLDRPTCDPEDVRYILRTTNATFPRAGLTEADVLSTWAGLRPLVADRRGRPSDISRRHEIAMSHPGWWDMSGGKLTTYRLMAEEAVDQIVAYLGVKSARCETARVLLLPNSEANPYSGILPPPVSKAAVEHYCRHEWARHLDDVMFRRTSWRYYNLDHLAIAERVARWMAGLLGWDQRKTDEELAGYRRMTGAAETAGAPPRPVVRKVDDVLCVPSPKEGPASFTKT